MRLSASRKANDDRIEIVLPTPSTPHYHRNTHFVSEGPSIGAMVRWVAQQLYAPKRLLIQPDWINRVPMHTVRFVSLYQGGVVSSMLLASWRAGDYYVTAVLLRNVLGDQNVKLNYARLRGQWTAVSFFRLGHLKPLVLTPARTACDTTTAILVSTLPFRVAFMRSHRV